MKSIYNKVLILVTAFSLFSCSDFLDTQSNSTLTQSFIFEREGDIFRAIKGVYSIMTSDRIYGQRVSTYYPLNTDCEFGLAVATTLSNERYGLWDYTAQSDNKELYDTWNQMYIGINRANECISGIEKSQLFANAPQKPCMIRQLYGEVKALRAILYLDLVRSWGDVPFKEKPTQSNDNFYIPPTDRDTILDHMINDLVEAEPYMLSVTDIPEGIERVSQQAVEGLIARIALTRGGWSLRADLNNTSSPGEMKRCENYIDYYKIANLYAKKVYESGKNKLSYSFKDVFYKECQGEKPAGDDMMYEMAFAPNYGSVVGYWIGVDVRANDNNVYGSSNPNVRFPQSYFYSFNKKDLRRNVTCCNYYYIWGGTTDPRMLQTIDQSSSAYRKVAIGKWNRMWTKTPLGAASRSYTGINWPMLRYADVLLMLAETENEINNGPTALAKECLRQVRKRAFSSTDQFVMVDQYITSISSKDDFFNAIVNERAWEFGGEAIRKYDLIRWNLFKSKLLETIKTLTDIGYDVNGNPLGPGKYKNLPKNIYTKLLPDGTLDIQGLDENLAVAPAGYKTITWLSNLVTTSGVLVNEMGYCYKKSVIEQNPFVYIYPIHKDNISDSQGALKNYYGKN